MPFVGDLVVRRVGAVDWQLVEPIRYRGRDDEWVAEAGFVTDLASGPDVTAWLIPRAGVYTLPAILHDWFCRRGIAAGVISAVDADGVFRRMLREEGVDPVLRWWMWAGVRWSAATDPRRRAGWWRTAPQLVVVSATAVPFLILPALAIWPCRAAYHALEQAVASVVVARSRTGR